MSSIRRHANPGRREREARKRHRRARVWFYDHNVGAMVGPLKLGRKHHLRRMVRILAVADSRNSGRGDVVMSLPGETPQQAKEKVQK